MPKGKDSTTALSATDTDLIRDAIDMTFGEKDSAADTKKEICNICGEKRVLNHQLRRNQCASCEKKEKKAREKDSAADGKVKCASCNRSYDPKKEGDRSEGRNYCEECWKSGKAGSKGSTRQFRAGHYDSAAKDAKEMTPKQAVLAAKDKADSTLNRFHKTLGSHGEDHIEFKAADQAHREALDGLRSAHKVMKSAGDATSKKDEDKYYELKENLDDYTKIVASMKKKGEKKDFLGNTLESLEREISRLKTELAKLKS